MISGNYTNRRIGSTVKLQCKAPMIANSTIRWLSQDGSLVNSSALLIIKPVNYSINKSVFICSVSSSQLKNSINRTITFTIKGICMAANQNILCSQLHVCIHLVFSLLYISNKYDLV